MERDGIVVYAGEYPYTIEHFNNESFNYTNVRRIR